MRLGGCKRDTPMRMNYSVFHKIEDNLNFLPDLLSLVPKELPLPEIIQEIFQMTACPPLASPKVIKARTLLLEYMQSSNVSKPAARKLCISMMTSPILSRCAILLNANRVDSTGKRTWLGVWDRSKATIQIFKLCACPLDLLNLHSAI